MAFLLQQTPCNYFRRPRTGCATLLAFSRLDRTGPHPQWTAAWSLKETMEAFSYTLRTTGDGNRAPPRHRLTRRRESAANKRLDTEEPSPAGGRASAFSSPRFSSCGTRSPRRSRVRAAPGRDDERRHYLRRQRPRPQQGLPRLTVRERQGASARSSPPTPVCGTTPPGRSARQGTGTSTAPQRFSVFRRGAASSTRS